MAEQFKNITLENLETEHLCCAISDKKHQCGVGRKKEWLRDRIPEGHVFRKLDANGKIFIEYAPLEKAWVPVIGENYVYIYCLWVSGSFKGKGYGRDFLNYCLEDARAQGKSGICILSSKKKKPYLSEKKFLQKFGFETVDSVGEYELLALSFDGTKPSFSPSARTLRIDSSKLTIYYSHQCPFICNCIQQVETYCKEHQVEFEGIPVDSLKMAKSLPAVFNNWAVFYKGEFQSLLLMNEGSLKKFLEG